MLVGLAVAAAVAGGNLLVTTTAKPVVWRHVRIAMTGEVRGSGTIYVYRNVGADCGNSKEDEDALGRKAHRLLPPVPVKTSFGLHASYLPRRFGVKERVCAYLYTPEQSTGLPPDAGYSESEVRIRFGVPPDWRARTGSSLRLAAIPGRRTRIRASGVCGGRAWRIESVPVDKDGSFAAFGGGIALAGRFMGSVTAVRARVTGPGCPGARLRLAGRAPVPTSP